MKNTRISLLVGLFVFGLFAVGFLANRYYRNRVEEMFWRDAVARRRNMETTSSSSQPSPSPIDEYALLAARAEPELRRIEDMMREMAIPTPSSTDTTCIREELGIRFRHPESWGSCRCNDEFPAAAYCTFSASKAYFGGLAANALAERGLRPSESIAKTKPSWDPIITRALPTEETVEIWHDFPEGWTPGVFLLAFRAPTKHKDFPVIGFVGPSSSSSGMTAQDVRDFLLVAYTYHLLP